MCAERDRRGARTPWLFAWRPGVTYLPEKPRGWLETCHDIVDPVDTAGHDVHRFALTVGGAMARARPEACARKMCRTACALAVRSEVCAVHVASLCEH